MLLSPTSRCLLASDFWIPWSDLNFEKIVMVIGLLEIELSMPESRSLKDKRMVLKSLKDRIGNKFNVSVAETAYHDQRRFASMAAVVVSGDSSHAHRILEAVARFVENDGGAVVCEYRIQML
jgi:uncharacterized protein YlxP (DUF503 family)